MYNDFSEAKLEPPKDIIKPKLQEVLTEIEKSCLDARRMWDTISLNVKASSNKTAPPKTKSKRSKQVEARKLVNIKIMTIEPRTAVGHTSTGQKVAKK